jgi:hypothetical protein
MNAQLASPLTSLVDYTIKNELLYKLWGSVDPTREDLRCMQSYFNWYVRIPNFNSTLHLF